MKLLITSGGTSEKIDQVRSITNHSTGQLGKIMAEKALNAGHQVTLITTKSALKPAAHPHLRLHVIKDTEDLLSIMQEEVPKQDALVHAMAVSDYKPVYMTGLETVKATDNIENFLEQHNQETKISSKDDYQVLFLKKNPKIISLVKKWNPSIQLIGFKLLVDVPREELIQVAKASLESNQASMIVANDLVTIQNGHHQAFLVSKDQVVEKNNKEEIAEAILTYLTSKG